MSACRNNRILASTEHYLRLHRHDRVALLCAGAAYQMEEEADQVEEAVLGSSLLEALVLQAAIASRVASLWADAAYQMEEEADQAEEAVLGSSLLKATVLQAAMTALEAHTAAVIEAALA